MNKLQALKDEPLYKQLQKRLLEEVQCGGYLSGQKFLTINEIADKYKVSRMTARQAVMQLQKAGILYSRPQRGTFINNPKGNIKSSFTIGAAFLDIYNTSSPYLSESFRGLTGMAREKGMSLVTMALKSDRDILSELELSGKIDGLVLTSWVSVEAIVKLREIGLPFVWLDNDLPLQDIACILVDKIYGMLLSVDYLIAQKRKRIAMIDPWGGCERLAGCKTVLESKGLPVIPELLRVNSARTYEDETAFTYKSAAEILDEGKPDGLVVFGEVATQIVIRLALERGLKIPDDLAIVSCTNIATKDYFPVPVGVIKIPLMEMSGMAVDLLHKMLRGEHIENAKIMVKPYLVDEE
ncbi:MAG: GntR family transcriptional regulator [Armatimonadota bacterium]|jgi:DNA-binding LacI/PurR family transcriptional regulator